MFLLANSSSAIDDFSCNYSFDSDFDLKLYLHSKYFTVLTVIVAAYNDC